MGQVLAAVMTEKREVHLNHVEIATPANVAMLQTLCRFVFLMFKELLPAKRKREEYFFKCK